jgi:hypothetical protein
MSLVRWMKIKKPELQNVFNKQKINGNALYVDPKVTRAVYISIYKYKPN